MSNIFDEVNFLSSEEIVSAARLKLAGDRKSYVCPQCGNGSHGHKGDGIRQKPYNGKLIWHCYSGSHEGDPHMSNADVCALANGVAPDDKAAVAKLLAELFPHLKGENFSPSREKSARKPEAERKDYSQMYAVQRKALPSFVATQGGTWRGLTLETLQESGAGYNAKYKSVILPYDAQTFFWREVDGQKRGVNEGGKRRLYVPLPLKVGRGKLNFLTEGEIDALSVKQAIFSCAETFGVAATGSANFVHMLIRELNATYGTCAEKPRIVWLGDNDKSGVDGAKKMCAALNAAGYPATAVFFARDGEPKVDANDYLRAHSTAGLRKFLLDALEDAKAELDSRAAAIKLSAKEKQEAEALEHGIRISSLAEYLENDFDAELDRVSEYSGRATGFDNLDSAQIFLPGVYILGGSPGAGKTTFAWQLLSQLAEGDECKARDAEHCVYCSYEMSRLELASKSLAREMRRRRLVTSEGLFLSGAEIRRGAARDTDEFKAAKEKFKTTALNLRVAELSNTTLPELLVMLKAEAQAAGTKPLTVAIDYLQLIPVKNSKATAKERVDEIMLALKTFQRETNSTLIILSSMNRESLKIGGNGLFSFKESGAIEYSADVTWNLGYDSVDDAKATPRRVEFKCLKNRNGAPYTVYFDYYADSDYFCAEEPVAKKKSNRR